MSLVFAGIAPHPPILLPSIGKENVAKVHATKAALEQMEKDLYVSKPDVIMVISPHGQFYPDVFSANAHPQPRVDLKEFGDLATTNVYNTDNVMLSQITESAKILHVPFVMTAEEKMDHGTAVPLLCLTGHLPKIKIISVNVSQKDLPAHFDFGYFLKEEVMKSGNRVAVIASADLSHRLTKDAPAGFSTSGQKFDDAVISYLQTCDNDALIKLDPDFCEEVATCGLRPIVTLLGVTKNINCNFKVLSYEGPFGVGYLTAEFILQ